MTVPAPAREAAVAPPAAPVLTAATIGGNGPPASLATRLALAAGIGRGIKSIADVAKPAIRASRARSAAATPLDGALKASAVARDEGRRAMAESELNLAKMYARDHDGMIVARGLLVGVTKALTRLCSAVETLEQETNKARAKLMDDAAALATAKTSSISVLMAEREALVETTVEELRAIETDSNFSLTQACTASCSRAC